MRCLFSSHLSLAFVDVATGSISWNEAASRSDLLRRQMEPATRVDEPIGSRTRSDEWPEWLLSRFSTRVHGNDRTELESRTEDEADNERNPPVC